MSANMRVISSEQGPDAIFIYQIYLPPFPKTRKKKERKIKVPWKSHPDSYSFTYESKFFFFLKTFQLSAAPILTE